MATRDQVRLEPEDISEHGLYDVPDFSLALGGPLFQLFRKSHLTGDGLELLYRRLLAGFALGWIPLLVLSVFQPSLGADKLSFFHDIEVHVRFLVALPALITAELIVHHRLRPVVRAFLDRQLVLSDEMPVFRSVVQSAVRLRNSIALELCLILLVYTAGLWIWGHRESLSSATWYAMPGGHWNLTPAGYWYVFVSIPMFQFILLRWYMRFFIWYRFLWQVSRMQLHLIATHPDRCAGLAFLGKSAYAFGPILFAQGALLAGVVATRILYGGATLLSLKFEIGGFVIFFLVIVLGPLLMFTPSMAAAKRRGLAEYGWLAQRYVEGFERRWVSGAPDFNEVLGSADIQSLADMGNSYSVVREMRAVPFGLDDVYRLAAATATPLIPLLLTMFSPQELLLRIMKIVF